MTRTVGTTLDAGAVHAGGVAEHLEHYTRTFNSGDADAINRLYTEDAVSHWEPGKPLTGQARKDDLAAFLTLAPRLTTKIRESYVMEDTALLIVDWSIEHDGEDGGRETISGIGADVLTRAEDGEWRYAIDDPFGDPRNVK